MMTGCHWIPAPAVFLWLDVAGFRALPRFWRPTIAGFRQLDIKRACKDEEFNFRKRFTVLNRFSKIKEAFTVRLKMIFVDHYFRLYQTL
jgi:hypothetical protein